jgi:hypothetical protein
VESSCMYSCFDARSVPARCPPHASVTNGRWRLLTRIYSIHIVTAVGREAWRGSLR